VGDDDAASERAVKMVDRASVVRGPDVLRDSDKPNACGVVAANDVNNP